MLGWWRIQVARILATPRPGTKGESLVHEGNWSRSETEAVDIEAS